MNEARAKNRRLKLAGVLLGVCLLAYVLIKIGAGVFDFDSPWRFWTGFILMWGGAAVIFAASLAGAGLAGFAMIRRGAGWLPRCAALPLCLLNGLAFLSVLYMTCNPFRHWVLLTAARHGVQSVYEEVGRNYMIGKGTPRNMDEALRWIKTAADSGNDGAMVLYAQMHGRTNLLGVTPDPKIEEEYLRKAAEAGSYNAQIELETREWVRTHPSEMPHPK